MQREFRQVDVFSAEPMLGNPVAVVHDAQGLSDDQMAAFARWTNLSETTFLLPPSTVEADYRVRIFTPGRELPFAGHPTLGTAHAWLEAGGAPRSQDLVQECSIGLVRVRRTAGRLAFAAPDRLRSGPVDDAELAVVARGLGVERDEVRGAEWVDNGPGWMGVLLADAQRVLDLDPDPAVLGDYRIGVVGRYGAGAECAIEVRAFVGSLGVREDPVTGSLNAGIAQWLAGSELPASYVASQGTVMQRRGRVHIDTDQDGTIWVGGDTRSTIAGSVSL